MRKNEQITYTKKELCQEIANDYKGTYTLDDVQIIIDKLSDIIQEHLTEANENHSIRVKPMNGLSLISWFVPEQKQAHIFGKTADVESYVRVKSNLSRYFKRNILETARAV